MKSRTNISKTLLVLSLFATFAQVIAAPSEDPLALIKSDKFEEAAKVLKAKSLPTGRENALLCYLYVRNLVAYEATDAKSTCKSAAAARDPLGLYVFGVGESMPKPPAGLEHNEDLALGAIAQSVQLDYYPAYDWMCSYFFQKNDFGKAVPFCKFAAVNQQPTSAYYIGLMLYAGSGAVQDFKKARLFTLASAHMNYGPAYKLLGDLSREGKWGTSKDLIQAYAWYALASSASPDWAEPVALRDALRLNADDITEAQKLAAGWIAVPAAGLL